jgi:HD-GYP domain-containing protein (c-di-GMP phosphodiesterase class II)
MQGFYVRNQSSITKLADEQAHVYVDPRRYDSKLGEVKLKAVSHQSEGRTKLSARERLQHAKPKAYEDTHETQEELPAAESSLTEAELVLRECVAKLQSSGGFDVDAIEQAITPLVHSVMRNQTALAALTRMRQIDNYVYSHAISCSVWGAVVGRQLGLPPDDEWIKLKNHVEHSMELLERNGMTDVRILNAVQAHHERHDGSGYPHGLAANKIPAFGRIAGIVDSYDAMISERPYATARSSYNAVQEIHGQADVTFQQELVEYFIKAIGVFPVGAIVELNTGEAGIVVSQSENNRLKPKIMLILQEDKRPRKHLVIIDLSTQQSNPGQALQWWITKELPSNAYCIDPQQYFLS